MIKEMLKQKLNNNISKYSKNIDFSRGFRIHITKGKCLGCHSKHFHCLIQFKDLHQNNRSEYIFAKCTDEAEFNNLLKIYELYQSAKVIPKIPAPLEYFSDFKILVMEEIRGKNLLLYFLINLMPCLRIINRKTLEKKVRQCASWLAEFHNLTYIRIVQGFESELKDAKERLEIIPYFSGKEKKDLIHSLTIANESIKNLPISLTNRDFSPRNMIFDKKNELKIVDWAKIIEKNIYYSIAYFFTNLESRTRHYIYSPSSIEPLKESFWIEYRKKSKFDVNEISFNIMKKLYYMEYLYEYYTKTGVFEEWSCSTKAMDRFVKQIANNLLSNIA